MLRLFWRSFQLSLSLGDHNVSAATTGGLTDSLPTNGSDTDCALTAEGHGHTDCADHSDCALSTEGNSDVATIE